MKTPILLTALLILLLSCETKKETEKLIFHQDFNAQKLDTSLWNFDLGNGCPNLCGWGNNERQLYTKENVSVKDGKLVIKATKQDSSYFSGKIHTKSKFEFTYGTIEVKAKLPQGHGLWPAIWMLGHDIDKNTWPACGEIDIMEYVGKEPHTIYTSLHNSSSYGNTINSKKTTKKNIEEGFHVYKTEWSKDAIVFYIDGEKVYTYSPNEKDEKNWPYDKPFYLILNLAIGGNFGGPEVDDNIFPQEFIIDYIKVYSL
ncbi:glycoside hydrolase family 16 protein [uncultured Tenacibaculum sp.]|uniref:glycoside hydrolase family 16 protein n=1 Tax=uncultured Tenacibaculum sp. TaxID=174713 RepID=UPI002635CC76|nr:glycoside hydrolase family 16 protein [uncultured Tenacibaculum sp.]